MHDWSSFKKKKKEKEKMNTTLFNTPAVIEETTLRD